LASQTLSFAAVEASEELSMAVGTCHFGYRLIDGRGQHFHFRDTFPKILVILSNITTAGGFEITLRALEM
jgi:cyanophycinase-like exopeptidase